MSEILFADDDPAMREMVSQVFGSAGYRVRVAENGDEALAELRRSEPDIAVLDYRMGVPDGLQVCRSIKSDPRLEHVPVLILTGESEIESRLAGFDAGADDYLAKPFDPRELLARVRAMLLLAQRGLDRNPTSGLPGGEAMYREFERHRREGKTFCICYLDLDFFKPFSDRFGFAAADKVIRTVGSILIGVTGTGTFVGHVGGDDFVVFVACRDAREQILDHHARAVRQRRGPFGRHHAIIDDAFPAVAARDAAFERQPCDARDRGQRLAAKTEGRDQFDRVVGQLRGCMAFERERHVGGGYPAPIVLDLDPRNPALGDSHRNASRTGVDGVFNQFLERSGGSFNHFTGRDPIYELFRQAAY